MAPYNLTRYDQFDCLKPYIPNVLFMSETETVNTLPYFTVAYCSMVLRSAFLSGEICKCKATTLYYINEKCVSLYA